jgi:hypothetical protein
MKAVLDRMEGEFAILELAGKTLQVPVKELPDGVQEGDVLVKHQQGWQLDVRATRKRKQEAEELSRRLWED